MLSPETSPTGKSNSKSAQGEVGSNSWDTKTSTSLGLRTHKLASDCNKETTKTELQEVTSSISKEVFWITKYSYIQYSFTFIFFYFAFYLKYGSSKSQESWISWWRKKQNKTKQTIYQSKCTFGFRVICVIIDISENIGFVKEKKNYAVAAAVFNQLNDPSLGNITDLYVRRSKIRQNVQKTHLKSGSSAIRQEWLRFMSPIFENSIVKTAVNIWKSYIWTADKDVNIKAIIATMNTT